MALRSSTCTIGVRKFADAREAELEVGCEPLVIELIAARAKFFDHVAEVVGNEMRQHEPIVQRRVPIDERFGIRCLPEAGDAGPQQEVAAPGSSGHAAAFRMRGTRPDPVGR